MTLSGIETHQSPLTLAPSVQPRREVAETRSGQDATDKAKEQLSTRGPAPVQDQISLSREAQALSISDSQSAKNNTFEKSPFDK